MHVCVHLFTHPSFLYSAACRLAGPVCSQIATKVLKARPATVGKATEACMLLIELEQQAAVLEGLMKAFADKVPKVVVAALEIIHKAIRCVFGA
jgi:hypothetical protein